jgi:hypothetical protein
MYVVRLYKNKDTNKILGAKVVDEATHEWQDLEWKVIREAVRQNPELIANVELDKINNTVKMKNMYPQQRFNYYNRVVKDDLIINQYCIIIGTQGPYISFVMDSSTDVVFGNNATIYDLEKITGIKLKNFIIYNGLIANDDGEYNLYIYDQKKQQLIKTQSLCGNFINNNSSDWCMKIKRVEENEIIVNSLEHKYGAGKAELPDGITALNRFNGGVNEVIMPDSIRILGTGCFSNLDDLYKIKVGNGIKIIPARCFYNSALREISMSGVETSIGEYAFADSLLKGIVRTNAAVIEEHAFESTNIEKVSLYRAQLIKSHAFAHCSKLEEIKLSDNIKIIGPYAFESCDKLKTLTLPAQLNRIAPEAFSGCSKLSEIIFEKAEVHDLNKDDTKLYIRAGAFRNCKSLKVIHFPDNVARIQNEAFTGCNRLEEVFISKSTLVADNAFPKGCKITYY